MGEYYLHVNGWLVYKPLGGVDATIPSVVRVWQACVIRQSPETFLDWLAEVSLLGALDSEVWRLFHQHQLEHSVPGSTEFILSHFQSKAS